MKCQDYFGQLVSEFQGETSNSYCILEGFLHLKRKEKILFEIKERTV